MCAQYIKEFKAVFFSCADVRGGAVQEEVRNTVV